MESNPRYIYPGIIYKPKKKDSYSYTFLIADNKMDFDPSIINGAEFSLDISIPNKEGKIDSGCSINNGLIDCYFDIDEIINENFDIILESNYSEFRKDRILYALQNYAGIRTYTIKADKIKKLPCDNNLNYQFQIEVESPYIEQIYFNLNVSFRNENEKENIANCSLNNNYINCTILEEGNCSKDIIISNITIMPNKEFDGKNTFYFENFEGKRTLTIRPGKLSKGICNKNRLEFQFFNNNIPNEEQFNGEFQLEILIKEETYNSICNYLLNEIQNNNITCFVENYNCLDDEIISIGNKDPEPDYNSSELISIYFEGFANIKYQICINIKKEGMILKNENEKNKFYLTNNQIINNQAINESSNFNLGIKISNIQEKKEKEIVATCTIPVIQNYNEEFDIECTLKGDISEEDEIIIIEEPENGIFDFSGYKNRRTLALYGGHLEKDNNANNFMLINNKFTGEVPNLTNEIIQFNITNSDDIPNIAICSFNINSLKDDYIIDMYCEIENTDDPYDTKTISILNNPNIIPFSEGITLYFNKFSELSIHTLTLGNILKNENDLDQYQFSFINSNLSKNIPDNINLEFNIIVNNEPKTCICE